MKNKKTEVVYAIIILALLLILFVPGRIGVSAKNVERDARKSQKIPQNWEACEAHNKEICVILFYDPQDMGYWTYSIYTTEGTLGYRFRKSVSGPVRSGGNVKYSYKEMGHIVMSLNDQRISKIVINDGERGEIEVDPDKPFVKIVDQGVVQLYDVNGKKVED